MLRISRIIFLLLVAMLLLWQLPWIYNFFSAKASHTPFTLYSSVAGEFAMLQRDENKVLVYTDGSGRKYTESEFDSILPTFYYRQLIANERFPDSICGVPVTPRKVQTENFNMRLSPLKVNAPVIGLYPLLESMSGRVDLELPDDVFRITDAGIEFIDMATNSIKEEKSAKFTEMMKSKGFNFPAYRIEGNPTDRKEYDEGYVILDANRHLFHLKQTKGRPYCRAIELPEKMTPEYLYITETPSRRMLAFVVDTEGGFWVIERPSYKLVRTELPPFNPACESMLIIGNLIDWTVGISDKESERYYALSADDYSLIDTLTYHTPDRSFPGLVFTTSQDKFVKPRLQ